MRTFDSKSKRSNATVSRRQKRTPYTKEKINNTQQPEIRNILRGPANQAQLTIGAPNDKYEQEADRVAEQVMRMPDQQLATASNRIQPVNKTLPNIQRMCPECEIEPCTNPVIQRKPEEKEREKEVMIQTKASPGYNPQVPTKISNSIQGLKGGGQPLSNTTRSFFEPRFGTDLSGVRVHKDTLAADLSKSINAKAFTLDRDVVFGEGQYVPESIEGKKLIAHELTHVVQQSGNSGNTGIIRQSPDPSDSSVGNPGIRVGRYVPLGVARSKKDEPVRAVGNPGKFLGIEGIHVEQPNGPAVLVMFQRVEAIEGTWLSAATQKLGWDAQFGKDRGYGAYVRGLVFREDDLTQETDPDNIEPGEKFLVLLPPARQIGGGEEERKEPSGKSSTLESSEETGELAERVEGIPDTWVQDALPWARGGALLSSGASAAASFGILGTGAGAFAPPALLISFIFSLSNAYSAGTRLFARDAVAAAVAAWAFDEDKPPPPEGALENVRSYKPQRVPDYEKAWREAVDEVWEEMPKQAIRHFESVDPPPANPIVAYKEYLRRIAKDKYSLRNVIRAELED